MGSYFCPGPKALAAASELGDGLVLQIGDPGLCRWFTEQAVQAGEAAGRDMSGYNVMAAAPAWIGPMEACLEQTRWFPAMVGNHVADIVDKYGRDSELVPQSLTTTSIGVRDTTIDSTAKRTPSIWIS